MKQWLLKRMLSNSFAFLLILLASFLLIRLAPGSPFQGERHLAASVRHHLEQRYGLDLPIWQQFYHYLRNLLHGDLGWSLKYPDQTINRILQNGLPATLCLSVWALLIALLLGIGGALVVQWPSQQRWFLGLKLLLKGLSFVGITMPSFVLAPLLIWLLALQLQLLPPAGFDQPIHVLLPALTLGTIYGAHILRLLTSQMRELAHAPWVRAAWAKGLSTPHVLFWHILIPAMVPLLSYLGPMFAGLLVGSVVVETIFFIPGIGPYFIDAALNRDYFLVMGIVVVESFFLLLINTLVDIMIVWIDPRIRDEI